MKKGTKKKGENLYKVSVKVLGKFFNGEGASLMDAVSKLEIPNVKGISVWKVEHSGIIREKVVMPFVTSNLFNSHGVSHEIALKKFLLLFENL